MEQLSGYRRLRRCPRRLLAAACGKRKAEVEELLARYFPQPDVPSSVRQLPVARTMAPIPAPSAHSARGPEEPAQWLTPAVAPAPPPRPLSPDRYEVRFTISGEERDVLREVQDMLRHVIPNGDPAKVFVRALRLLRDDLARKKYAATLRPRASRGPSVDSDDVPAKVKRAVCRRDGGRCAFTAKNGRR